MTKIKIKIKKEAKYFNRNMKTNTDIYQKQAAK